MMKKENNYKQKINYFNFKLDPKDAIVIKSIYKEIGIYKYDPNTVNQLLQYVHGKNFYFLKSKENLGALVHFWYKNKVLFCYCYYIFKTYIDFIY